MKIFFTSFLFLIFSSSFSSQTLIHPTLPPDMITDLHYLNNLEVIFINSGGSIYKSYDGGVNWELKNHYPNNHLAEIQFLDNNIGFIRTQNFNLEPNKLIFTNDGGETWNKQDLSIYPVNSFLPVSESVLLKAALNGIQRLDNFYNNWQITYTIPTFVDSGSDYISTVSYGSIIKLLKLNDNNIIALGVNENAYSYQILDDSLSYILKSVDSGLSWDTLWIGLKEFAKEIIFIDDSTGWMISDTSIFKTSDGGKTWDIHDAAFSGGYYKSIFARENNIYLLDYYNSFIKSTDLGITWSVKTLDLSNNLTSIVFNDENNGFLFGEGFFKTSDSGENWEDLNPYARNDIYEINFISNQEGIALGNVGVYKTYDGGYSWSPKFNPGNLIYNHPGSLEMINDSAGFLVTSNFIYKTTDKGENWEEIVFYDPGQWYQQIKFYKNNLGILTTSEESVPGSHYYDLSNAYISTDAGESWSKRSLDSLYFDRLEFSDPNHLWGANYMGLWLSKDTAGTWEQIYRANGSPSFDFYDSLVGIYSAGYWGSVYTIDGGKTWRNLPKDAGSDVVDSKVIGPDYSGRYRILESGSNGLLLLTYISPDGEIDTYESRLLSSFTGKSLNDIDVFVENGFPNVWVAGDGFIILYRLFEKIFVDVKENGNLLKTFALYQNYPNPFNPSTTIRYQIPQKDFVSLKIYNLLGQEIKTLVNKEQLAGTYNAEFNGKNLCSGIYFYTLRSGNFTETKKFILLK